MKLTSGTLRTFTSVHSWVGLVAGFALFVAFYAGAITMFQRQLQQWATPHAIEAGAGSMQDAQRLLDGVLARHPEAHEFLGMLFPGPESPQPVAYWMDSHGVWQYASAGHLEGSPTRPLAALPELINELHFSLGIPLIGTWLMGLVSLLYGVALVTGFVIHLPQLVKDFMALRAGRNLKRFWQDAHNVIGVLSLPFHLMFAVSGAVLCLLFVLMMALDPLIYGGKLMGASGAAMDTAPTTLKADVARPLTPLAQWYARSVTLARERGVDDFEPAYLKLTHAGDAHAVVEITGASPRALGTMGAIALDATSGNLLTAQLPGRRDANHATLAVVYGLHYGDYGNVVVRWLYFLLGLGGAFLFYSGNLLWIESRRKRRQQAQGRAHINMARATVGICLGFCVAVSVAFVTSQLLPAMGMDASVGIRWSCYLSWLMCALWASRRAPIVAARELLWLAAIVTATIPLVHGIATGWWLWRSAAMGHGTLLAVDAVALALAFAFAALARATNRRAHEGDANSVWALPR